MTGHGEKIVSGRPYYYSPGPSALPEEVLRTIQADLSDPFGIGVSVLEISHRSEEYGSLSEETIALARAFFEIPSSHEIILSPFGAQHHFCLLVSQLTEARETVAYADTGHWSHIAVEEARRTDRRVVAVFDGRPAYKSLGDWKTWEVPAPCRYLHLTVNNTIYGTEYPTIPKGLGVPLVLDMTSAIGARTDIPWEETAMVYASAQKNFGIAGLSIVVLRKDVLERSRDLCRKNQIGNAMSYLSNYEARSILNTPPVFALFASNRMLQWMIGEGGVKEMEATARIKAATVYGALDEGFYKVHCQADCRSRHNFVFHLPTAQLDSRFLDEARSAGLLELKGFKTVGGVRASIYNGMSVRGAEALAGFARSFRLRHG